MLTTLQNSDKVIMQTLSGSATNEKPLILMEKGFFYGL